MACVLWPVWTWAFRGILCTCRFLWICPYNAVQFLPRERHKQERARKKAEKGCECRAVPGGPARAPDLHRRLAEAEKDIQALKTRISSERASWEQRFTHLRTKQEQLLARVTSGGAEVRVGRGGSAEEDGGEEVFEECMSEASDLGVSRADTCTSGQSVSSPSSSLASCSSSVNSVAWRRRGPGPRRAFAPHSALDLQPGHRVRVVLASGRVASGDVRFVGRLQGEAELQLGVELQSPDPALADGRHRGRRYFECKPGHGAFVPFHKLLMAWE